MPAGDKMLGTLMANKDTWHREDRCELRLKPLQLGKGIPLAHVV